MTKLYFCSECDHTHPKTHMIRIRNKDEVKYICGVKCERENDMYCTNIMLKKYKP